MGFYYTPSERQILIISQAGLSLEFIRRNSNSSRSTFLLRSLRISLSLVIYLLKALINLLKPFIHLLKALIGFLAKIREFIEDRVEFEINFFPECFELIVYMTYRSRSACCPSRI
jgi:hypothetical protein